jgi:hypothetical protein
VGDKESAPNTKAKMQGGKHVPHQFFKTDNQGITSSSITQNGGRMWNLHVKNCHINANKFNSQ